jgi:hypothetical protein
MRKSDAKKGTFSHLDPVLIEKKFFMPGHYIRGFTVFVTLLSCYSILSFSFDALQADLLK